MKFAEDAPYLHHFSGLGGCNPPTNWPQGSAGKHAAGDTRFTARIEPNGRYGTLPTPGGWMFYTYWIEMKQSADGGFWDNGLWPEGRPAPPRGRWQCVEIMVKCNEIGKSDGELALWLDGKLAPHITLEQIPAEAANKTPLASWWIAHASLWFSVIAAGWCSAFVALAGWRLNRWEE